GADRDVEGAVPARAPLALLGAEHPDADGTQHGARRVGSGNHRPGRITSASCHSESPGGCRGRRGLRRCPSGSVVSPAMGQMVAVTEEPSSTPGVVRYVLNRTLTGMGHEYFDSPAAAVGSGPAAVLARRLFATEQVDGVHVYANIVTVQL